MQGKLTHQRILYVTVCRRCIVNYIIKTVLKNIKENVKMFKKVLGIPCLYLAKDKMQT